MRSRIQVVKGRLLQTVMGDPYSNVALEEALFLRFEGTVLRVWENQRSVVIGRAQRAEYETDIGYCRRHDIPIVRRFTGGGAVYNGPGNINWSFFVPALPGSGTDAKGAFRAFAGIVVRALGRCGVEAEFIPPNGIAVGGGKVSGLAAYMSKRGVLCHGTLLVAADLGEVVRVTTPRDERVERKYARSRNVRVANCGVGIGRFVAELAGASGYELEEGRVTQREETTLEALMGKYRSEGWNLGDPFQLDYL
jgi:lipoate---protein ligase